jgi:hypothetical protein
MDLINVFLLIGSYSPITINVFQLTIGALPSNAHNTLPPVKRQSH